VNFLSHIFSVNCYFF